MNLTALNQTQAAALLTVAPRTLRDWHDAPRNRDGSYNGPALVAYYVAKLAGNAGEFDDQRERLNAAQAEKVETENAVRRGEIAVVSDLERVWTDHIAAARAKLLSLPSKLAPQLAGINEPNVIAAAIRADIYAALSELAEYTPTAPAESDAPEGVADVDAAAGADGQPVGRRRKATQ
jgi:phage terminase Nu1 subunit (DNA packaging protein)